MENGQDSDAANIIIRVWGSPHFLMNLAATLDLFSEVVSGNIKQGLIDLAKHYNWMKYEHLERTLYLEDPSPSGGNPCFGVMASPKLSAIMELFRYIFDDRVWNLNPQRADSYQAVPEILTLFRARECLCTQFHNCFPYFESEFQNIDPTEIFMYYKIGQIKIHWEVLLDSRQKEGRMCLVCECCNPRTKDATEEETTCAFRLYRTEFLEQTDRNPYFDDDNR